MEPNIMCCVKRAFKFTIVEMLLVVAVIGILVSLLLPSLQNARQTAKTAISMANLRSIYQATVSYVKSNNGNLFVTTSNYHIRNKDTTTNWSRMVYEEMRGELLPSNGPKAQDMMVEGTPYYSTFYCPLVRGIREPVNQHAQGRSDYGMNKFFRDEHRKFITLSGENEPLITPVYSGPNLNHSAFDASSGSKPIYEYPASKTIALFIDGRVTTMSISRGAELEPLVSKPNDFQ